MSTDVMSLAMHYLSIGQPERALAALDGAPSEPDDPELLFLRGAALFDLEQYEQAAELASRGLTSEPDSPGLLWLLTVANAQLGRLAAAERSILAALELYPDSPDYLCTYADVVARAGQFDKADRLIAEAAKINPDDSSVLSARIDLAYLRGDNKRLEALTRELLARDPESMRGHQMMGLLMLRKGAASDSLRHYSEVVRQEPGREATYESAVQAKIAAHPLMLPLRPLHRAGVVGSWIAVVVGITALRSAGADAAAGVLGLVWLAYCIYSWVVPGIVERRVRGR
jgi:tetratricopeptide (TPR) repeat protein